VAVVNSSILKIEARSQTGCVVKFMNPSIAALTQYLPGRACRSRAATEFGQGGAKVFEGWLRDSRRREFPAQPMFRKKIHDDRAASIQRRLEIRNENHGQS
jgi:hypothetical protein